jgi:hypothetical protein
MMIMAWEGVSTEQYDEVKGTVDWEGNPAEGGLMHATAHDGKGLRITDVWESPEAFQAFVDNRLMPVIAQVGIESQPNVEIYPLHDLFIPGS